jgi:hypothetical protein
MAKGKKNNSIKKEVPRRKHLRTARQCRAFLAKVTNELYLNEIEESRAGKLAYIVSVLLKSIEVSELEQRIQRMEEIVNGKN